MRHSQVDKRLTGTGEILEVFAQPSVSAQPGEGALHDPTFGLYLKAFDVWLPGLSPHYVHEPGVHLTAPLQPQTPVRLVSIDDRQTRQRITGPLHQRSRTLLVGDTGRMHNYHQHQPQRVHQNVALTPFDVLAGIVADRACYFVAPPFSAVFTDWLSRMATEGSGSLHSSTLSLRRSCSLIRSNTPASRHSAKYLYTVSQGGRS
jgi:hypothetical protein